MAPTLPCSVTRVVLDGEPVDVVRFAGSTTHGAAVRSWLSEGAYIDPTVTTRDIIGLHIPHQDGHLIAHPGDFVTRRLDGTAGVYSPLQYQRALGERMVGLAERVRVAHDGSAHLVLAVDGQRLRILLAHASLALQADTLTGEMVQIHARALPLPGRRTGDPFTDPIGQQVTAIAAAAPDREAA